MRALAKEVAPGKAGRLPRTTSSLMPSIPCVNYHLWAPCNMQCRFCFAPFHDVRQSIPKGHLPEPDAARVVDALCAYGFEKVNFVGGEPMLCPWLPNLLRVARQAGVVTTMVTNGSRLTPEWLDRAGGALDWIGISMDSASADTHRSLGRSVRSAALSPDRYVELAALVRDRGIRLKVNTVVTTATAHEDMSDLILSMAPERWKVFQVLPVAGQNDGSEDLWIEPDAFQSFVDRHARVNEAGVEMVPEPNGLMRGSYAMVDPAGRFFDNAGGGHAYSAPILEVGVEQALSEVAINVERFEQRGGAYNWA